MKNKNVFYIYIIINIIAYINTENTDELEEKPFCSLYNDCDKCILCKDYENCNYYNILCYQNKSSDYKKNDELKNNLSIYYNDNIDIINFCHSRNITLDSVKKSFIIFESPSNKLKRQYHCHYYVTNEYYLGHDSDKAKINFEIKKRDSKRITENTKINFFLIFLYKSGGKWRFFHFDDEEMRKSIFKKELQQISEFEILLDFFYKENSIDINEHLILSISTEHSNNTLKKIYIAIILVLCIFLLVIIITAIIFFIFKRKLSLSQERQMREEKRKLEKNKKLIEKFKQYELKPKIFNEKINFNNCDSCSICCENFTLGKSEVSITPCSHVFHYKCIIKWVNEKNKDPNCPNCNYKFIEYMNNPIKKSQIKRKRIDYDENKTNSINMKNTVGIDEGEMKRHYSEDLPSSEYLRIKVLPKNKNFIIENKENNNKSGKLTLGEFIGNNNNLIEQ